MPERNETKPAFPTAETPKTPLSEVLRGLFRENPTFRLVLGMCPTLAVTTSVENGLGMGLAATLVLVCSNALISALRNVIPEKVHIPCYIVVIASLVTVLERLMQAYTPALHDSLGIFIPLIVVNCIILGRAEAYAARHPVLLSAADFGGSRRRRPRRPARHPAPRRISRPRGDAGPPEPLPERPRPPQGASSSRPAGPGLQIVRPLPRLPAPGLISSLA